MQSVHFVHASHRIDVWQLTNNTKTFATECTESKLYILDENAVSDSANKKKKSEGYKMNAYEILMQLTSVSTTIGNGNQNERIILLDAYVRWPKLLLLLNYLK